MTPSYKLSYGLYNDAVEYHKFFLEVKPAFNNNKSQIELLSWVKENPDLYKKLDDMGKGIKQKSKELDEIVKNRYYPSIPILKPEAAINLWSDCLEHDFDIKDIGCNAELSTNLFPIYKYSRSYNCGIEKYKYRFLPVFYLCKHPKHGLLPENDRTTNLPNI